MNCRNAKPRYYNQYRGFVDLYPAPAARILSRARVTLGPGVSSAFSEPFRQFRVKDGSRAGYVTRAVHLLDHGAAALAVIHEWHSVGPAALPFLEGHP